MARITSGLVDVLTTAPEAAISAGIITALVFPTAWRAEDHHGALGIGRDPFSVLVRAEVRAAPHAQEPFPYTLLLGSRAGA